MNKCCGKFGGKVMHFWMVGLSFEQYIYTDTDSRDWKGVLCANRHDESAKDIKGVDFNWIEIGKKVHMKIPKQFRC